MNINSHTQPSDPTTRAISLLKEARWLALLALAIYLLISLIGYSNQDPSWSHITSNNSIQNPGGRLGAWLSDFLLSFFGNSIWLIFLYFSVLLYLSYPKKNILTKSTFILVSFGFILVLFSASALASLRWLESVKLPTLIPGGIIGYQLAQVIAVLFGRIGGTLLALTIFFAGFSFLFRFSWIIATEKLGDAIILTWFQIRHLGEKWYDRLIGYKRAKKRSEEINNSRSNQHSHSQPPPEIKIASTKIIESSKMRERKFQERQEPLFVDIKKDTEKPLPLLNLLDQANHDLASQPSENSLEYTSRLIEKKLEDFGVSVKTVSAYSGPVVTRYEIEPAKGTKGATILSLSKDLARALGIVSLRVVETIPGKTCMALELPNSKRQTVHLSEIIGSENYSKQPQTNLTLSLGKDISGEPVVAELNKMPHLLVAGTTGSGKSVGVNAMILSLLYKFDSSEVRFIMIDPKMLELSVYEGIPHLLAPVVTDMSKSLNALQWCVNEMERRYKLMSMIGVRNLGSLNAQIKAKKEKGQPIEDPFSLNISEEDETQARPRELEALPFIVVVIDELADLMMVVGKKIETLIARLAQKARAAGIHLIVATQRPSVDVITGLIKANIPSRIAFQVSSKIDSRTILDQMGAEALLGQGDMLYLPPGTGFPIRVHGAFASDSEVQRVANYLRETGAPNYVENILEPLSGNMSTQDNSSSYGGINTAETDPLYDQAIEIVLRTRRASISLIQRNLRIGYNRAARLVEDMEKAGLVSAMGSNGNRTVLAPDSNKD